MGKREFQEQIKEQIKRRIERMILMSYWWELEEEYKKLQEKTKGYKMALEIIANIEKKVEQKPYGTVVYTPTLESIQRFAGQVLAYPEKVKTSFTELNIKSGKGVIKMNKLRAWDDELKEMLYSKIEQFDDGILFRFNKHLKTEKPIYLRYAGITDMRDVDIYEGDIVLVELTDCFGNLVELFVAEVVFNKCEFGILRNDTFIGLWDFVGHTYKVIGNIYEHPELLNTHFK